MSRIILENIAYYLGANMLNILVSLIPLLFVLFASVKKWRIGILAFALSIAALNLQTVLNLHLIPFDEVVLPVLIGVGARRIVTKQLNTEEESDGANEGTN